MSILEYIKNGLPKITLGEVVAFGALLVAFCKGVEDIFGKKYLGTWIWNGIKRFFLMPVTILNEISGLRTEVKFIREEVQYNGGKIKLRDAVEKIGRNVNEALMEAKINGKKLTELDIRSKISEECDPTLIFKLDDIGGCIYCNQSFYNFFGFNESDIKGFNWESVIAEKDLQEVRKRWDRAIATKSQFLSTHSIIDSEGKAKQCRVIGLPIVLEDSLKGFYGTVTPE